MIKTALQIINPATNALRNSPPEYKFWLSILLASMWCIAFSIFTAELLTIGHNIIGHYILIFCVFITWRVFKFTKKHQSPTTKNKVVWDLNREG